MLAALQGFQFLQRARPVLAEQTREAAVRQHLPPFLAARTIVGFVAGIADALDFLAAARARLAVAPMHGHPFAERGHLLRNFWRASAQRRSIHSARVSRVAACSRTISSVVSLRVWAMGDRRAACRISSE